MKKILFLILTIGLLAACTSAEHPEATQPPLAQPAPSATPVPTAAPLSPSTSLDQTTAAPMIAFAAQALGIPSDQITIVAAEPMEWADGCLGLADPGEMCTMMITPGYLVTLETPQGQVYFHTNQTLDYFRMVPFTPLILDANTLVVWNRAGGIAGICQMLIISRSGSFVLADCRGDANPISGNLPDADWQYLQEKAGQYAQIKWEFEPPTGSADMFIDGFSLEGAGSTTPKLAEQEEFNAWLADLARRLVLLTPASSRVGGLDQLQSGIKLTTLIGPSCGGPVQANDPQCGDKPYAATLDILDSTGALIQTVQTDSAGQAAIDLPAGSYTLQPQSTGRFPVAQPQTVVVPEVGMVEVTILYDSGLR